jgi:hypothetical protein
MPKPNPALYLRVPWRRGKFHEHLVNSGAAGSVRSRMPLAPAPPRGWHGGEGRAGSTAWVLWVELACEARPVQGDHLPR